MRILLILAIGGFAVWDLTQNQGAYTDMVITGLSNAMHSLMDSINNNPKS